MPTANANANAASGPSTGGQGPDGWGPGLGAGLGVLDASPCFSPTVLDLHLPLPRCRCLFALFCGDQPCSFHVLTSVHGSLWHVSSELVSRTSSQALPLLPATAAHVSPLCFLTFLSSELGCLCCALECLRLPSRQVSSKTNKSIRRPSDTAQKAKASGRASVPTHKTAS